MRESSRFTCKAHGAAQQKGRKIIVAQDRGQRCCTLLGRRSTVGEALPMLEGRRVSIKDLTHDPWLTCTEIAQRNLHFCKGLLQ